MLKTFVACREDRPGQDWRARFQTGRPETESWYRRGADLLPSPSACRQAIAAAMPELLAPYDHVCGLLGDDPQAHRMLSQYRPAVEAHGCSQAVWLGADGPALVRNYDFPLEILTGRFELSDWSGRRVIGSAQRPWGGLLDGMNEDGLVASLTHGGGAGQALGFAIILILRYVLETCRDVADGIEALRRVPVAQSQNVTLLDASGRFATVFLVPGGVAVVTDHQTCTNHQDEVAANAESRRRRQVLDDLLARPGMGLASFAAGFLEPPLYSRREGFTTGYSSLYRPQERSVEYFWPDRIWRQSFDAFDAG
ncbi:MAG: C45 family autoproteolytic acyltransferase/hydrolase, partial [Thalassobaculaceae bacterium]|nr:C45 family autoproteolytic acyltransferase/hydrolase [Thalassobaculaceae bacterium]